MQEIFFKGAMNEEMHTSHAGIIPINALHIKEHSNETKICTWLLIAGYDWQNYSTVDLASGISISFKIVCSAMDLYFSDLKDHWAYHLETNGERGRRLLPKLGFKPPTCLPRVFCLDHQPNHSLVEGYVDSTSVSCPTFWLCPRKLRYFPNITWASTPSLLHGTRKFTSERHRPKIEWVSCLKRPSFWLFISLTSFSVGFLFFKVQ